MYVHFNDQELMLSKMLHKPTNEWPITYSTVYQPVRILCITRYMQRFRCFTQVCRKHMESSSQVEALVVYKFQRMPFGSDGPSMKLHFPSAR